jgi:polynucleotide 5'-hydroxyl-kinase GRC3/NOL9
MMRGIIPPRSWSDSLEYIKESKGKVLILGENDTGKSTLTLYLASELAKAGITASIVDADVGQSLIGPPTTVGLGEMGQPYETAGVISPSRIYFVGAMSPRGHLLPLIVGVKQCLESANGEVVLINTTGFVKGAGMVLKTHKIEITRPDVLLALQREEELEPLLRAFPQLEVRRLEVPKQLKRRSPLQRKRLRENLLKEYFRGSQSIFLEIKRVSLQRAFEGDLAPGMLCGLADVENSLLALGVVEEWKKGESLKMRAPLKRFLSGGKEDIRIVQLSRTFLTKSLFGPLR